MKRRKGNRKSHSNVPTVDIGPGISDIYHIGALLEIINDSTRDEIKDIKDMIKDLMVENENMKVDIKQNKEITILKEGNWFLFGELKSYKNAFFHAECYSRSENVDIPEDSNKKSRLSLRMVTHFLKDRFDLDNNYLEIDAVHLISKTSICPYEEEALLLNLR